MDLISIIIPVYNVKPYIERCIRSVLDQTYTNLEVIIVNDGSTDSTGKICEELALGDKRITFISQENEGQSAARNKGLNLANGKWIIFLDSDDWLESETLQSMHDYAEKMNADIRQGMQ